MHEGLLPASLPDEERQRLTKALGRMRAAAYAGSRVMSLRHRLKAAEARASERISEAEGLKPPEGFLFAVWSLTNSFEVSYLESRLGRLEFWKAPVVVTFETAGPNQYHAVVSNLLKNEPTRSPELGAEYAYAVSGEERYRVGGPDYCLEVVAEEELEAAGSGGVVVELAASGQRIFKPVPKAA